MKRINYITVVLFVCFYTLGYAQITKDEFLADGNGGVFGDLHASGGGSSGSDCDCVDNFSFNWGSSFNTAIANQLLLNKARQKALFDSWYKKQQQLIKNNIESKLGKTYSDFNSAKNDLFFSSEVKNTYKNHIPPKQKYQSLKSSGFAKQASYLKELKLLKLRRQEIITGNINNPSFGFIKINGTALKDFKNLASLDNTWESLVNTFSTNNVATHINKYIYEKLQNITNDSQFKNLILQLKNSYYNRFGAWDKLDFLQFLLNYEQYKQYSTPPYALPSNFYKFNDIDKATTPVIEDYAIQNREGGLSVFDDRYWTKYFNYVTYRDYHTQVNEAKQRAATERQNVLENLINDTSTAGFAIDNLIAELSITDIDEKNWLHSNQAESMNIINFLNANRNNGTASNEVLQFSSDLVGLLNNEASINSNALAFIDQALKQNKIYNNFDTNFLSSVNPYTNMDLTASNPWLTKFQIYFTTKCAVLRYNHPTWSDAKIYWEASKGIVHITLDAFGMIPVVGEIADLTNGVLYLIEGDGVSATLSFAATAPFVGWGATAGKYAVKLTASTLGTKVRLTWRVLQDGTIYFGSTGGKLRKVLGITDSTLHAHHLIPWAMRNHELVQKAAKSGNAFHLNEALNGIPRPSGLHLTGHSAYNAKIFSILENYKNSINSIDEAYDFISGFADHIRTLINNNPNLNSGQIANLINYP